MQTTWMSVVLCASLAACGTSPASGDGGLATGMCELSAAGTYPGCAECRSDDECYELTLTDGTRAGSTLACFVRGSPRQPLPGAPPFCGRTCESDPDCGADRICVEVPTAGCSPLPTECRDACAVSGCGAGYRCEASGRCERIPCDEAGGECGANRHCEAPTCVQDTCTVDADCATGPYCVRGLCEATVGSCLVFARP
ncbi:MAG: hypothetical protein AB7S26_08645 [Sandaracinaceae bacterium]